MYALTNLRRLSRDFGFSSLMLSQLQETAEKVYFKLRRGRTCLFFSFVNFLELLYDDFFLGLRVLDL